MGLSKVKKLGPGRVKFIHRDEIENEAQAWRLLVAEFRRVEKYLREQDKEKV